VAVPLPVNAVVLTARAPVLTLMFLPVRLSVGSGVIRVFTVTLVSSVAVPPFRLNAETTRLAVPLVGVLSVDLTLYVKVNSVTGVLSVVYVADTVAEAVGVTFVVIVGTAVNLTCFLKYTVIFIASALVPGELFV